MKFRYYIRGFGAGLIVAAAVLLIAAGSISGRSIEYIGV